MPVILPQFGMAYFAVPKIACSSVKTILFEAENRIHLEVLKVNGEEYPIHRIYPTRPFSQIPYARVARLQRYALVRDPIDRFLSAYRNRILEKNEIALSKQTDRLLALGLPLQPSLSTFIAHLQDYHIVWGVAHHFSPIVNFLGRDPEYFSWLNDISQIDTLFSLVSEKTGWPVQSRVYNSSGHHKVTEEYLSAHERRILEDFYAEDYKIYGRYFC